MKQYNIRICYYYYFLKNVTSKERKPSSSSPNGHSTLFSWLILLVWPIGQHSIVTSHSIPNLILRQASSSNPPHIVLLQCPSTPAQLQPLPTERVPLQSLPFAVGHCMRARAGAGPTWWRQRAAAEDLVPSLLLLLASPLYSCVSSGVTNCTACASLLLPSTTLLLPSATLLRYMPSSYNFISHRVASQHLWSDKIFPPIYRFPILQTCFGRRAAYLWKLLLYYINTSIALRQVVSSATIEVLWLG
jgi:hypothetical protein